MFHATLTTAGPDNDLLDGLGCKVGEAVLDVARELFGANLWCVGGTRNQVLTRVACYQAGGYRPGTAWIRCLACRPEVPTASRSARTAPST
jgi:hypothetical protein